MRSLAAAVAFLALVALSSAQETNAIPPMASALTTCIDDSDCAEMGDGNQFRCFLVSLRSFSRSISRNIKVFFKG